MKQDVSAQKMNANDTVRVSIVLDKDSTLEAGFSADNIAENEKAMN